jgi:protein-disulfide isomerase
MKKELVIAGFLVTLVAGVGIGLLLNKDEVGKTQDTRAGGAVDVAPAEKGLAPGADTAQPGGDSDAIPISSSPVRGEKNAPVTLVVFTEFQCGFCARAAATVRKLETKYKGDLRVVFKHRPLRVHENAKLAARAALAAEKQGKFWEYHDALFADWTALERRDLESRAQKLGLDMTRFQADLDSEESEERVEEDLALALRVDASSAPTFFINGHRIAGSKPLEVFVEVIDTELKDARGKTYAERVAANFKSPIKARPTPRRGDGRPPGDGDKVVYKVPIGNAYTRGPKDAIVTIVEFSEFECSYCTKVHPTIKELLGDPKYKDQVRLVFKHRPLSFHKRAIPAAKAALAAGQQGKFWEYHDRLFENPGTLEDADFERHAKALGLNVATFRLDYASDKFDETIRDDTNLGLKVGASGTPHFFVNGVRVKGTKPLAYFQQMVDEAIERAKPLTGRGLKGDALYAEIMKDAAETYVPVPKGQADQGGPPPPPTGPVKINIRKEVPVDGPADAKVTIVEFSDFQCPYCSKAIPIMAELKQKYGKKIRVAFMHMPLDFHNDAKLAAQASLAAHDQGKFWEYHNLLFENQTALQPDDLNTYAQKLGLNMGKFKKALKSGKYVKHIERDMQEARKSGASGTPTFYVNGRQIVGAQPVEEFSRLIDEELAK